LYPTDNTNGIPYSYFSRVAEWYTIKCLINPPPKRVLEIGAGTGGLALEAFRNGVRDYSVIDIPSVGVMSAYFSALAFGEDKIWLAGEESNSNATGRWFSCYDYESAKSKYDLIANVNSFPEMSIANQDGYMAFISECLSENGVFYSCNHESNSVGQNSVRTAVNRHGGFRAIYRAPFMMREGYVEELYTVKL
jgi:putative sugar O-methyltransferase